MAKITKKVAKSADAETTTKLAKVNKKSVTIQKSDKKPVKNLKEKAKKTSPTKKTNKPKSLQKKTTPTGGSSIVPKKNAPKTLAKAKVVADLIPREQLTQCVAAFRKNLTIALADRKAMLDPDFKYNLTLCSFKIPQCPERIART